MLKKGKNNPVFSYIFFRKYKRKYKKNIQLIFKLLILNGLYGFFVN